MEHNLQKALDFVLRHEGEYVNDPDDPGGETKFGISKRAYPNLDIASLTIEEARKIYKRDYWDAIRANFLFDGMDIAAFDSAVNCGVQKTQRWINLSFDSLDLIMFRLEHYNSLNKPMFMKGWINRLIDLWKEVK